MFCEARKHRLTCGRGAPVVQKAIVRTRFGVNQLDHFLNFVTSPAIWRAVAKVVIWRGNSHSKRHQSVC